MSRIENAIVVLKEVREHFEGEQLNTIFTLLESYRNKKKIQENFRKQLLYIQKSKEKTRYLSQKIAEMRAET